MDGKQKSVAAITQELQNCSEEALIALCSNLRTDPRKSVQLLAEKAMKRLEKEKKELERVQGMIDFEREIAGSTIYCGRGRTRTACGTSCGGSCHYAA